MIENLVIVESPAKAKTIERFLGKDYLVKSSFGHVRDLAKKNLGIDINNQFKPDYIVSADKKKIIYTSRDSLHITDLSDKIGCPLSKIILF